MTERQPNILFVFPDQHRPDWLGCAGTLPLRTPNIDRLATRGVRFTNAYTPSPICSPARACLATGRDYVRCGVRGNNQNTPLELPTYYRQLRAAGYEVCGVGKFDLHKPDHDWGLDGSKLLDEYGFTRGCDNEGKGDAISSYRNNGMRPKGPYMQFLTERGLVDTHLAMYEPHLNRPDVLNFPAVTDLPDWAYCDNWVADNAMRYLQGFATGRPWHLVVNFVGPHGPFDVTPDMHARWRDADIPPPVDNRAPDHPETVARRRNYAAMIENIDMHIGRMLELIRQRGELDNTLVVYASDHGEMLGDHNRWAKGVWYEPSANVPLVVAGPGVAAGVVSPALVALHDLAATFTDYAQARELPECDARSLRPVLEDGTAPHRDIVESAYMRWHLAFDGRYKLVTGAAEEPLLYDLQNDPHECRNVAGGHPDIVAALEGPGNRYQAWRRDLECAAAQS